MESAFAAATALIGVALGGFITHLNQRWQRRSDRIAQLRTVYSQWAGALLRLRRLEVRMSGITQARSEMLSQLRGSSGPLSPAKQQQLVETLNRFGAQYIQLTEQAGQLNAEAEVCYAAVILSEYCGSRKKLVSEVQAATPAYLAGSDAGAGSEEKGDLVNQEVFDKAFEKNKIQLSTALEQLEVSLRQEEQSQLERSWQEFWGS
jgi:hypothetical protein